MKFKYRKEKPFAERLTEAARQRVRHPGHVPIVVERNYDITSESTAKLRKNTFMAPAEGTFGLFYYQLEGITDVEAVFFMIYKKPDGDGDGVMVPVTANMGEVYKAYKADDGFLYVAYALENTFGGGE